MESITWRLPYENREMILENSLPSWTPYCKHFEVPYKPPTGFVKE